jgi:uncharacterized protein (TIGR03000 family)
MIRCSRTALTRIILAAAALLAAPISSWAGGPGFHGGAGFHGGPGFRGGPCWHGGWCGRGGWGWYPGIGINLNFYPGCYGPGYYPVDGPYVAPVVVPPPGYQASYPPQSPPPGGPPAPAENTARFQVRMPAGENEVWLNGVRTRQTGAQQWYKSPPMTPGEDYSYEVRARWTENGQTVERTRTVLIHANDRVTIDLTEPSGTARK